MYRQISLLLLIAVLGGCATLGSDYQRPDTVSTPEYSENSRWKAAVPAEALPKGAWWKMYHDNTLDELQLQARNANQEIQGALARLEQARAAARIAGSDQWPRLDFDPSARRSRSSDALSPSGNGTMGTVINVPFDMSYEIDLWGKVRRSAEAATALYQASAADVENLFLSVHAEVARNYFVLRGLDAEVELLERTTALREQNLQLVESRYRNGQSARLDVARAETELASARAEVEAVRRQRAQIEHALAVLTGNVASSSRLAGQASLPAAPVIAAGLPSELLERRPDVAAAERRLMAANARIGVAKAAFFPSIRLTGSAGYSSDELNGLFDWGNRVWALGPSVTLPIFNAGRNSANLEQTEAAYTEAVANYRQSVLVAFRDVEDALSNRVFLDRQHAAQQEALRAAQEAATLSAHRYQAGQISYLEVIDSERTALAHERAVTQIRAQQLQASVALVKALGGGWEAK